MDYKVGSHNVKGERSKLPYLDLELAQICSNLTITFTCIITCYRLFGNQD